MSFKNRIFASYPKTTTNSKSNWDGVLTAKFHARESPIKEVIRRTAQRKTSLREELER